MHDFDGNVHPPSHMCFSQILLLPFEIVTVTVTSDIKFCYRNFSMHGYLSLPLLRDQSLPHVRSHFPTMEIRFILKAVKSDLHGGRL